MPGCHRWARGSRPAVSERLVCPGARVPLSRLALPLSKRPGSTSVGFINRRFLLRITAGYICGKRSAYLCAIAAWRVDSLAFLSVHRTWIVHSQVKAPVMGAAQQRDPQHFPNVRTGPAPFYTSDPHGCAQQNLRHVRVPGWQAAAVQRAGACARRSARRTRIWAWAWVTSPTTVAPRRLGRYVSSRTKTATWALFAVTGSTPSRSQSASTPPARGHTRRSSVGPARLVAEPPGGPLRRAEAPVLTVGN